MFSPLSFSVQSWTQHIRGPHDQKDGWHPTCCAGVSAGADIQGMLRAVHTPARESGLPCPGIGRTGSPCPWGGTVGSCSSGCVVKKTALNWAHAWAGPPDWGAGNVSHSAGAPCCCKWPSPCTGRRCQLSLQW